MNRIDRKHIVCLANTPYILLVYLLYIGIDRFKNTFFFCSEELPKELRDKLNCHTFYKHRTDIIQLIYRFWIKISARVHWPFLRGANIYGGDHYFFSSAIVGGNEMTLIEDGISNYSIVHYRIRYKKLKRFLFGELAAANNFGISSSVKKIILTGISNIPIEIQNKTQVIDLRYIWNGLTLKDKNYVLDLFDMSFKKLHILKMYNSIFFTQPLYEDSILSLEEELRLYHKLLAECDTSKLVIKTHPRDKKDYSKIFPKAFIFKSIIPMELVSFCGIKFSEVYTIFSTAALQLPYQTNIHFLGTKVHTKLLDRFGPIQYSI